MYSNFEELRQATTYEDDYHILMAKRNSDITFVTIHGGGIELGCSELALLSAGSEHSYYCFEGWRGSNNGDLHITSTHFDEPNGIQMHKDAKYLVSYHGFYDANNKHTKIGGLDRELRERVLAKFTANGISAEILPDSDPISGTDYGNIVNSTKRRMGLQLEISTAQRNAFFDVNTRAGRRTSTNAEFDLYTSCVKEALDEYINGL